MKNYDEPGVIYDDAIPYNSGGGGFGLPPADWWNRMAVERMQTEGLRRQRRPQPKFEPATDRSLRGENNKRVGLLALLMKELGIW